MDLDDDELMATRELHTGEIRKKNLLDCNERELRIRCSFDEQYIKRLEKKIHELERQTNTSDIEVEPEPTRKLKKINKHKWEKQKKYADKSFKRAKKDIEDR